MLGIVSKKPISACYLRAFRALAGIGKVPKGAKERGHKDGWGIAYFDGKAPVYLDIQPTNAFEDERYAAALERLDKLQVSGVLLAHFRKRSVGAVSLENTLPFIRGKWCFAHNGTIYNFRVRVRGEREGATDSKRFFRLLIREIEKGYDEVEEAIERVVTGIRNAYKYSSLTFLLSDGIQLYAYREYSEAKNEDYYGLMYAKDGQTVLFAQEPIWEKDWIVISNGCLVVVDKELRIKHVEFGDEKFK